MYILDIFWLVRLIKVRGETEIEPILETAARCGGRGPFHLPPGPEAIIASTTVLSQLGHRLLFNMSEGKSACLQTCFTRPHGS